jgi:hypothetical protein
MTVHSHPLQPGAGSAGISPATNLTDGLLNFIERIRRWHSDPRSSYSRSLMEETVEHISFLSPSLGGRFYLLYELT